MPLRLLFLVFSLLFSSAGWGAGETALMPGEVTKAHAKLEVNCKECHVSFDKDAQTKLCMGCHKEVAEGILKHKGFHGHLTEKECRTCHTEHKGRNAKIAILDFETFDHGKTDFPLVGAHHNQEKVKCENCHEEQKKYRGTSHLCNDCHHKNDKHKGSLGTDCKNCHVETGWKNAKIDHSKTSFPLIGKHQDVKCSKCHSDPARFKETPHECVACHLKTDKHKGQFGKRCETCHTEREWKSIRFNHNTETKFKLVGKHEAVKCLTCHKSTLFKEKIATNCSSCHRKDDAHKGSFGEKCETCHKEDQWKSARFDHEKVTRFPLSGKHIEIKCNACHKPESKSKMPTACIGCHRNTDKHKGEFGTKCESCHQETGWKLIKFDHRETKFPLKGKHELVKCLSCHTGTFYQQKLSTTCYSCHKKDDAHSGQLGNKHCAPCHNPGGWKDALFDHPQTPFPLRGLHLKVECKKCHQTQLYREASTDCFECHKKIDDAVHKRRLGIKCQTCHTPESWKKWSFNHDKQKAKFNLDGSHKKLNCYSCHTEEMEEPIDVPRTCVSCHEKDDTHRGEFGTNCERCHMTKDFHTVRVGAEY